MHISLMQLFSVIKTPRKLLSLRGNKKEQVMGIEPNKHFTDTQHSLILWER